MLLRTYKHLGLHLDNKRDWSANTDPLPKETKVLTHLQRTVTEVLAVCHGPVYAAVWGCDNTRHRDAGRPDRPLRKAGSVVGTKNN